MAFRGRKVADIYAELHLDRDMAKAALRGVPAALGADADRAGRELGQKVTDGLARAVEASSARLAKARREETKATDAVKLAELRLTEAREKGNQKGSVLLALEQRLAQANQRLTDANNAATVAASKHAEAQRRLGVEMDNIGRNAGPNAERSGRELGGKLSQGIHLSIVRNSPLIAAAIGGALAVGAPVALAGATALFAGIGIVAAAQSQQVQSAWLGTWQRVKAGAIADAAVIEPVLVRMADRVGDGFDRMRPRLRNAFTDAAPQIAVFTDGILGLAERALPGLERAVARGMPVTMGLASFLEKTGTGLSDFFDRISTHSPAAGAAFSALGDTMAVLLPLLGELLGQGAELATTALPLLSSGLGLVLKVATALGPALPPIVTAIAALKMAQAASGWIGTLAGKLGETAAQGGFASTTLGRTSGVLSALGRALPVLGIGVGLLAAAFSHVDQQVNNWADAMRRGGAAAVQARADMGDPSFMDKFIFNLTHWGNTQDVATAQTEETTAALRRQWQAMDPLAQAQAKVAEWSATLRDRMLDESASSADVEAAKRRLTHWQSEAARLADAEAKAIRGVTEAMVEQADQSRSLVDAQFAYQHAVNGVEDAVADLAEAQAHRNDADKDTRTTQEDVERAALAVAEAYSRQAAAARRIAEENLPASMDDSQRAILGAKAELDELNKIAAKYTLPPELEAHRQKLMQITGQADGAMLAQAQLAAAVGELGFAVSAIPGEKHVTITAPTDALKQKLAELGFTIVELPNGDIQVVAETAGAQSALGLLSTLLVGLNNTTATPTANLDDRGFTGIFGSVLGRIRELAGQRPTPTANLDDRGFSGIFGNVLTRVRDLAGQRPTPVASLDADALNRGAAGAGTFLAWLGGQRPTPVAGLNAAPFAGTANWVSGTMGWLNGHQAYPLVTAVANVANAERHLAWVARNRTVTIWTNTITDRKAGGPVIAAAGGRKVVGPGGPTDDLVPALGPGGALYRLSNTEWIINALVSRQQGDDKMAALNAGLADIVLRGRERVTPGPAPLPSRAEGFAAGGVPGRTMPEATHPDRQFTADGRSIVVEHVSIHIEGTFDLASSSDLRKAALVLRQKIIDLEREPS